MPQDVKIWEISEGKTLKEIRKAKLDLEERLGNWLEEDISLISDDLLVVGREVETYFGGFIDLLCIGRSGDLAVVELKRQKTPREVTAQALDYASWVKDLSNERITKIAREYLGDRGPLEDAFKSKFGDDIPEVLNENHEMIIVASEIDSSSERIIRYLSDYGVGINALTFQYFKEEDGREFLSRVFLIEPSEAEYRTQTRPSSKRKPNLTYRELEELAERNGIGALYRRIADGLSKVFDQTGTTRSSLVFRGIMGEKSRHAILSLLPGESDSQKGMRFSVYIDRFASYFGIEKEFAIKDVFPSYEKERVCEESGEAGNGYFKEESQIDEFLAKLNEFKRN